MGKTNYALNSCIFTLRISIDNEATQYLTAAGRAQYIRLPWYHVWQNSRIFISQNSILAELQLISKLLLHRYTEQMGGFASQYSSASFYTLVCMCMCERQRVRVCVCVHSCVRVCVWGFKALACLFPLRVTGVLMACQVSQETRDTGWVEVDNLSMSHFNRPLSLVHMVDVY